MPETLLKERPSILLVDDHPHNLVTLEAVLGSSEYHLLSAHSGAEALALVEVHDVALILLDIQMPTMDGYEVAKRLKESARTKDIPIIFVSAIFKEDAFIQKGYEVGAVDFFAKPFNPDVLRLKVGIYAELYQKNLSLHRHEEEKNEILQKLNALHQTLEEREIARRLEEERRAAELKTILESIPDAIYVGDEDGITRCNGAALAMFGYSSCQELNVHFETLADRVGMRYADTGKPIPPGDQPFAHALRGEHFVCQLIVRQLSTGKDRILACAAAPVMLDGQIIGAVVVNTDAPKYVLPEGRPKDLHVS